MAPCILCVVYPACLPYLEQFKESLRSQIWQDFEVLILNDGLTEAEILLGDDPRFRFRNAVPGASPNAHRHALISWALETDSQHFIFVDADDYFPPNRASICLELLKLFPIVVNDLILIGEGIVEETPLLSKRYQNGACISASEIREMNLFGLTNTSVTRECLLNAPSMPQNNVIAFDWLLFTHLLQRCGNAVFTSETHTFYRQYSDNIAPVSELSDERILTGVDVKIQHYTALGETGFWYRDAAEKMEKLSFKLSTDSVFREIYCKCVRKNAPEHPLWWEAIVPSTDPGL
jgi:glycosyltransferase involved in cell wall biosynthesis